MCIYVEEARNTVIKHAMLLWPFSLSTMMRPHTPTHFISPHPQRWHMKLETIILVFLFFYRTENTAVETITTWRQVMIQSPRNREPIHKTLFHITRSLKRVLLLFLLNTRTWSSASLLLLIYVTTPCITLPPSSTTKSFQACLFFFLLKGRCSYAKSSKKWQ